MDKAGRSNLLHPPRRAARLRADDVPPTEDDEFQRLSNKWDLLGSWKIKKTGAFVAAASLVWWKCLINGRWTWLISKSYYSSEHIFSFDFYIVLRNNYIILGNAVSFQNTMNTLLQPFTFCLVSILALCWSPPKITKRSAGAETARRFVSLKILLKVTQDHSKWQCWVGRV